MSLEELLASFGEITPTRNFNYAYIVLDSVFLLFLLGLLIAKKRYVTLFWSLFGGVLYLLVDFGIFYLALGSRHIYQEMGGVFVEMDWTGVLGVLTWMSLSYGITNFLFIWAALNKDKYLLQFSVLIFGWWLIVPSLSKFGGDPQIVTQRGTGSYHWVMAAILVIGYACYIVYSMFSKKKVMNILLLNLIGIVIQFGWEFALLVNGIRPWNEISLQTIIVNSLVETNLGMPMIYAIWCFVRKRVNEDLTKPSLEESDTPASC